MKNIIIAVVSMLCVASIYAASPTFDVSVGEKMFAENLKTSVSDVSFSKTFIHEFKATNSVDGSVTTANVLCGKYKLKNDIVSHFFFQAELPDVYGVVDGTKREAMYYAIYCLGIPRDRAYAAFWPTNN